MKHTKALQSKGVGKMTCCDTQIGPFTSLYRENLKSAAREGGSIIPAHWKSNDIRRDMELRGWLTSRRTADGFCICWSITDAGRAALKAGEK